MYEKIKADMIEAMKEKDKEALAVIKMIKAALDKERIDKKCEMTDDLVSTIVSKQLKMRQDSLEAFEKAGRKELSEAVKKEIEVVKRYLPTPLSKEEVEVLIQKVIDTFPNPTIKEMGAIMGQVSKQIKGRYDLKEVSALIRQKLN